MPTDAPTSRITLQVSWLPTWLVERLRAEAERREVTVNRIIAQALEHELAHGWNTEQPSGEGGRDQ